MLWLLLVLGGSGGLNEEWVAADGKRIEQLQNALDRPVLTVEALRELVGSSDVRDDRLIGFGARRVFLAVSAGYTTTWIHILAAERDEHGRSRIAAIRLEQIGPPEPWAELRPRLRALWRRKVTEVERGFSVERIDDVLVRELRDRAAQALGRVEPSAPAGELAGAFDRLTSPFTDLVLGFMYGEDGAPPPGRLEIEELVKAQRLDLVRAALRGMNPEGRAWAAPCPPRAQESGGVLDASDESAIETLRKLPLQLTCSRGCMVWFENFDAALATLRE
jgi:hypothetical protein